MTTKKALAMFPTIVPRSTAARILDLKDRWRDEREFENFDDYVKVVKSLLEIDGVTVAKVTKTFATTLHLDGIRMEVKFSTAGLITAQVFTR